MLELDTQTAQTESQATDYSSVRPALKTLSSLVCGQEFVASQDFRPVQHAITGETIYQVSSFGLDTRAVVDYAKQHGAAIASWTFHQRANALKQVAQYLLERKEDFYELAKATGCTRKDAWIDVEGGIGTLFAYSSLVRRELSDETAWVEDSWIPLSKHGSLVPNTF